MAPKPKPKKPKPKASLDVRIKTDAALRKRVLANPGLRSKLSAASLQQYMPAAAKSRALNARLNAPITPGSSVTERQLAQEAQAAQGVRYGPQESALNQQVGIAQQTQRDTGSLYDQYRQGLQAHQQNIQTFQGLAQQALQNLQGGITGLGQAQAAQLQQQANAGAAQQGVAQAGNLAPIADQALGVRQQFAGTFGAEQAMTGAAANSYADALSNVVAPGQKLGALAQASGRTRDAQQKLTDLKTEEGAFNQQFRDTRRQDEFKNVLAMQTLGIKAQDAAASAAASSPEAKTAATEGGAQAREAAKYGYSLHDWRMLGPTARNKIISKAKVSTSKTAPGSDVITSGALTGKTKRWVAAHPDEAAKLVRDYNKNGGKDGSGTSAQAAKDFYAKYHVKLQETTAHNSGRDAAQNAQTAFAQVGKVVKQADGKPHRITTDDVVASLRNGTGGASKTSPLWIRVGLELARGGLTPGTAARLHKAGYSVSQLGFPMAKPKSKSGSNIPPGKI